MQKILITENVILNPVISFVYCSLCVPINVQLITMKLYGELVEIAAPLISNKEIDNSLRDQTGGVRPAIVMTVGRSEVMGHGTGLASEDKIFQYD